MTNDEELTYKHFVIQLAETLLKRYYLDSTTDGHFAAEGSVYAILFGETIGVPATHLENILSRAGDTRNELVKMILEDMKAQFRKKSPLKMSNSLKDKLAMYLTLTYRGMIDDSRVRTLIGDIFLVSLIEVIYSNGPHENGIFDNVLLSQVREKKSDQFLNRLLELLDENSSGVQILSETIDNADYVEMAAALAQYLRYQRILDKIIGKSEDLRDMNYIGLLREHLQFLKHLSSNVYSFLDEEGTPFDPSESVFIKYFYMASLLVKTDYSNSIVLNNPYAAKFFNAEIKDNKPIQDIINSEADRRVKNIVGSNDETPSVFDKIFNPLRFLRKYFGIFGSWILWDIIVLIPLIAGLYRLVNYAKYALIIPDTTISIPGIF
ncbi:MAG: hypothetical protein QXU18_14360, partial [Thermoplasmatales archaeon]